MPAPDPTIHLIPLAEIDDTVLARDRTSLDPEALVELRHSIALHGLRMPIEIFALADPEPGPQSNEASPHRYGLISGFRRLAAFRAQLKNTGQDRYAAIPAFLRTPATLTDAVAAMVEENEIRADLSPWERGRIALTARDMGLFASVEEAVNTLYASANRQKRSRLRLLAHLAEDLEEQFTAPDTLSLRQCLRLASALHRGFGPLIRATLNETSLKDPDSQWQALLPILVEAETTEPPEPSPHSPRPDRPRRVLTPRHGLIVRREMTRDGWILRFTGREASGMLMDTIMDEIEAMVSGPR